MGRWRVNKICRAPRSLHARPGILRSRALQVHDRGDSRLVRSLSSSPVVDGTGVDCCHFMYLSRRFKQQPINIMMPDVRDTTAHLMVMPLPEVRDPYGVVLGGRSHWSP